MGGFLKPQYCSCSGNRTQYPPIAATAACAAGLRSRRPWQSSHADDSADLGQPEQIGLIFAGFQNDLYAPQSPAGSPDLQPPIRAEP